MGFHRGLGDEQVLGDLAVGQAVRGQACDPAFGAGERVRAGQGGAPGPGADREQVPPDVGGQLGGAGALGEVESAAQRRAGLRALPGPPQAGTVVGQGEGQIVAGGRRFKHADRLGQRFLGRCGCQRVRPQRDPQRGRGAALAGQRELLTGQRGRLVQVAERAVRGGRGGPPRRDRRVVDAEVVPARAGREQILERLGRAVLRDPQPAAGLPEHERVDPALRRFPVGDGRGDGLGLLQTAEAGERVDAEGGGPGDGQRRGGRELEVQRHPAVGGGLFELPQPSHDHRTQAAGVGDHAHRASPPGGGQHRIADAAGRGELVIPDEHQQGVHRGEGVGCDIAEAAGQYRGEAGQGAAGRLGGDGGHQRVVDPPGA